ALFCGCAGRERASSQAASPAPPSRPNIIFLLSDDQRADAVAAYGNDEIRTPELDRLVASGFSFRNAYCMGSIHGAVCQPSRAMINSGRRLWRVPMDLEGTTLLPEVLSASGYQTFGTGKWHNGKASFARGFEQGRAVFHGGMSDHSKVPVSDLLPDGSFTEPRISERFSSELFVDEAIRFLNEVDRSRPFYLYVAFTAPHDPRMPPEEFLEPYRRQRPSLPENFLPQHPFQNGWLTGRDETLLPWPRPPELVREQLAEYYGMISHMDAQIGRLCRALQQGGLEESTVIVFTSDQGLALGSHGLLGKQSLYEHSTRSPLVISGPGLPHGSSDALVYLFDLFPTIARLAGADCPEDVDGLDLAPLWKEEKSAVRETLFTAYEDIQRAVRDSRYKLIRYPKIHQTQLFDLRLDQHETEDLSEAPEQAGRVEEMLSLLADWQRRTNDEIPLSAPEKQPWQIDLRGRKRTPDRHQPEWIVRKYFGEEN
ncbi:MAG: sulfatase-like hydrolase/transferase, partial [Planctomycetota bacterium]